MSISFAEQAVRLVRDTGIYSAGRGVALRANDMLESGGGAIQLAAGGATVALGPASRIFVKSPGELVLLDGWLKLQGGAQGPMTVSTAVLRATALGTTATLHAAPGLAEVFAESGDVSVETPAAGKAARPTRIGSEQFATSGGNGLLRTTARPPAAFLAAMPRGFRDALVPVAPGNAQLPPKRERDATYAELAPWLSAHPALRQGLQRRSNPPRAARAASATSARLPIHQP